MAPTFKKGDRVILKATLFNNGSETEMGSSLVRIGSIGVMESGVMGP